MERLHYGVAYYDEYMPYERLDKDIQMMKAAGITVVRIAESTWSTHEPQNGVFDFKSVDRVLDAMHKAGIDVIIGTPTYAIPPWMVREHPEVLAVTKDGPGKYGARQIMDITSPVYLFYAERIIRKLIGRTCAHPAVIGYQIDNETKHYGTAGPNVQLQFVKAMREKFNNDLGELNRRFGLTYWSNRIEAWEDFPSVLGTINGSLGAEFARFQRQLVTDFLAWQAGIVNEYKKPGQFVTHNFDFEWRGHSYGVQRDVDHFKAAQCLDIAGVDIYHPSQGELTGAEISFGGDMTRSLKQSNYLVLETQAQAFPHWTPYPGQLRLLAFSHLASGASMVAYWHWHSIHNSFETYWKGLLSHDLQPNPIYNEAKTIGADFARLSESLSGLRKINRVAILVSNEALSAIDWFPLPGGVNYNDVVRRCYDALYKLNVGCDFIHPETDAKVLEEYDLIVVPALYSAPDELLNKLNDYTEKGGHVVYTFKSGFTNDDVQVRTSAQPGLIERACGVNYQLFIEPKNVRIRLTGDLFGAIDQADGVETWMELLTPTTAEVLARYDHPQWNEYAAITRNTFGQGTATYIGFLPEEKLLSGLFEQLLRDIGLWGPDQKLSFPLIVKSGINRAGCRVRYFLNYSDESAEFEYGYRDGRELLSGDDIRHGQLLRLPGWGFAIVEDRESAACSSAIEDGVAKD